jgi:hypothetical protein
MLDPPRYFFKDQMHTSWLLDSFDSDWLERLAQFLGGRELTAGHWKYIPERNHNVLLPRKVSCGKARLLWFMVDISMMGLQANIPGPHMVGLSSHVCI